VAYHEDLAWRVRAVLPPAEAVTERQMSGGLAFMLGGHMFCGVRDTLMVRLGPEGAKPYSTTPPAPSLSFQDLAHISGPGPVDRPRGRRRHGLRASSG
jgi:TfoX N-terminal domain